MSQPHHQQDEIDTAAAEWMARLAFGPLNAKQRGDLDRWLDESPHHAPALDEARLAWDRMGKLRVVAGSGRAGITASPATAAIARLQWRRRAWIRAGAIAACLLVAVGGARFWIGDPLLMMRADDRTAPGEHRLVTLADGSTADLGPASAIALRYSDGERRIVLLSGEAYFKVAPMIGAERRPFIVQAANGTARALGTQFMVDRLPDAVEVTVAEHKVEVELAALGDSGSRVTVSSGQSVRYSGGGLGPVQGVNLDNATAWRRDRLIFDHKPLSDVVAELNRYRRGRIVVADHALASRTVSGVFETDDPNAALATIARVLGVHSASLPPFVTLLY